MRGWSSNPPPATNRINHLHHPVKITDLFLRQQSASRQLVGLVFDLPLSRREARTANCASLGGLQLQCGEMLSLGGTPMIGGWTDGWYAQGFAHQQKIEASILIS